MIIIEDYFLGIIELKQFLKTKYEMKDLGHLSYFLGLKVLFDYTGYYLSQVGYATDILSCVGFTNNKIANTPLEAEVKLSFINYTSLDNHTLYRQLVKSTIYLTTT